MRLHGCGLSDLLGWARIHAYSLSVVLLAQELHPSLTSCKGLSSSANLPGYREVSYTHLEGQLSRGNTDHASREHCMKGRQAHHGLRSRRPYRGDRPQDALLAVAPECIALAAETCCSDASSLCSHPLRTWIAGPAERLPNAMTGADPTSPANSGTR